MYNQFTKEILFSEFQEKNLTHTHAQEICIKVDMCF